MAEAPVFVAVPMLFTIVAYPMIGLYPGVDHFFVTAGIVTLVANVSTSFGKLGIYIFFFFILLLNHSWCKPFPLCNILRLLDILR